jgi:hypothetical protein
MSTYSEKLKDPRWQKKRLEVMQRDGFKCRDCSSGTSTLHVHHCFYEKGDPWNTDDAFLVTLCVDCHEHRQAGESKAKVAMGRLFAASCGRGGWALAGLLERAAEIKEQGLIVEVRVGITIEAK